MTTKRHRTKAERKILGKTTPPSDGRQQIVQPITNLEETLEAIRQRREVEDEKDEIEELLKRKEQDTARARDTTTPVPSGDELTPSEANEEEPDLREKLDKTRRERDTLGEGPDLREALDRSRREKEKEKEKKKKEKKKKQHQSHPKPR